MVRERQRLPEVMVLLEETVVHLLYSSREASWSSLLPCS